MSDHQIIVRPFEPGDLNFIRKSWLRTYKYSSDFARRIRNDVFFEYHPDIVDRILGRSETHIAAYKDSPITILGFLVVERNPPAPMRPIIHFCYCKESFRRWGIATRLLDAAKIDLNLSVYTHRTDDVDWIEKKFPDMIYVPYLI